MIEKENHSDLNHVTAKTGFGMCVPGHLCPDGFSLDAKPNKMIVSAAEDDLQTPIQLVDGGTARTLNLITNLAGLDLKELILLLVTMPPSWDYKRRASPVQLRYVCSIYDHYSLLTTFD